MPSSGISFVTGISTIAGVSAVASMLTIAATGWVMGSEFVNLDTKMESIGLPNPKKYEDCTSKYGEEECTMYSELMKTIDLYWKESQPVLITCSIIALATAMFQLGSSLLVSFADTDNLRKRTRFWMTSHFVICLILLICILSVYLTRMGYGMGEESWGDLVNSLIKTVMKMKPAKDFASLITFLKVGPPLFYIVTGLDSLFVMLLFCSGVFVLQKYNQYEATE